MGIGEIIFGGFVNFLIWCLPLAIFTKVYVGYFTIGSLMGYVCYLVAAPMFNSITSSWYKSLTYR